METPVKEAILELVERGDIDIKDAFQSCLETLSEAEAAEMSAYQWPEHFGQP